MPVSSREKRIEYNRAYRAAHKKELSDAAKAYRLRHDPKIWSINNRRSHLKTNYGISPEGYQALLKTQRNQCAICHSRDWGGRVPHIDHNHNTGAIRGILCHACNRAIGLIKDNARTAKDMSLYLRKYETERMIFAGRREPFSIEELSSILRFSQRTINGYIKTTGLPYIQKGRKKFFMPGDIELWLRQFDAKVKRG